MPINPSHKIQCQNTKDAVITIIAIFKKKSTTTTGKQIV